MTKNKPLEAVILDLGGVVFGISVEQIVRSWAKSAGVDPREIMEKFKADMHYEFFEIGEISPVQYRQHVSDTLGFSISSQEFDRGWNKVYLDLLPGIKSLLFQLQRDFRLVALTNTNEIHAEKWRTLYADVLGYFEMIFSSHEIKARKPTPQSFQIVLDYLGVAPERTAFFDDSPKNVDGAIAVGINAFVATSPQEVSERLREMGIPIQIETD